ncbi:MAG: hypothetical protein ACQETE_13550 [Bacteroidota bacterium]
MKNKPAFIISLTAVSLLLTGCGDYRTKREVLADLLNDFFLYIGIDPINGFLFLLFLVVVSEVIDLKNFPQKTRFWKIMTVVSWLTTIGVAVLLILLKLDQANT